MSDKQSNGKDNLIDLAAERKRIQGRTPTIRIKKMTKTHKNHETAGASRFKWYHYAQLVLFMVVVLVFMRTCQF